jgi:hypothetical protein
VEIEVESRRENSLAHEKKADVLRDTISASSAGKKPSSLSLRSTVLPSSWREPRYGYAGLPIEVVQAESGIANVARCKTSSTQVPMDFTDLFPISRRVCIIFAISMRIC